MRSSRKFWLFNWIFKFRIYSKMTLTKVNHTLPHVKIGNNFFQSIEGKDEDWVEGGY